MFADGSLVSLLQGVSQQPPRERLPGQCTLQENMSSSPAVGLTKRPPSEFLGVVDVPEGVLWDDVIGYNGEHYWLAVSPGALRMFTADGEEVTVTGDFSYLTGEKIATEATDSGIIVLDTTVPTAMLPDLPSYHLGSGLVFLLGGQYGRTYRITIKYTDTLGVEQSASATYGTPDGSTSAHINNIATEFIMTQLATSMGTATFTPSGATVASLFTVQRSSDVMHIVWKDGSSKKFELTVDDGDGGANIFCLTDSVGDAGDLPRYAPHGKVVSVTGDGSTAVDDWYLAFYVNDDPSGSTLGSGFGNEGIWREVTAPGEPYKWNAASMPHLLVDNGDGTFTFKEGTWAPRAAGDGLVGEEKVSNPPPSFIGKPLRDVCTFQSRTVFCAGQAVIMSQTDDRFNFWAESATTISDSDPIDTESTAQSYGALEALVPHNRDLVVFSSKAQFIVFGRSALTPANTAMVLTCSFECNLRGAPVSSGRNVFYAINAGAYTGISEFYTDGTQDINDSRNITQHVRRYLTGHIRRLAASSNFGTLLVQTDDDLRTLYAYEYVWAEDQRLQSSWSKWTFPDAVEHFFFEESYVRVMFRTAEGVGWSGFLNLNIQNDDSIPYRVELDTKCTFTEVDKLVVFPVGCADRTILLVQGPGCPTPGLLAKYTKDGCNLHLDKSMQGGTIYAGQTRMCRYQPTPPMVKDQGGVKIGTAKLVIGKYLVQYADSGYLAAAILSDHYAETVAETSGRLLGYSNNKVGEAAISSGTLLVPCRRNSDAHALELRSDSHLPMTILDIEWTGQYTKKGRRMASASKS